MAILIPGVKAPAPSVSVWSRKTTDVPMEKLSDARELGAVRLNNSRLNVFSSLHDAKDKVDHFKFWVQSTGKTRLGMPDDPFLRVELLDKRGKVLADSDANSGDELFKKYLEFNEGGLELKKEKYYLRVSRNADAPQDEEKRYSLQLSMGDGLRNDYDTAERPAVGTYDPIQAAMDNAAANSPSRLVALQSTTNLLSAGMLSLMNNGKIGGNGGNSGGGLF